MAIGAPRKIESPEQMAELWEEFKVDCDSQTVLKHEFSQRLCDFVVKELPARVTYTIEGFCCFIKMSRDSFYTTYSKDPAFSDIVTRMKHECERDVRYKFESGQIPHQLSALWMSKHGYSVKTEQTGEASGSGIVPALLEYLKSRDKDA